MLQYLWGIWGCYGKTLSYDAQLERENVLKAEADDPRNNYDNCDEGMVKRYPIIEPGHETGANEEDGPFGWHLNLG